MAVFKPIPDPNLTQYKLRKSRSMHQCTECEGKIYPFEHYHYGVMKDRHYGKEIKVCRQCWQLRERIEVRAQENGISGFFIGMGGLKNTIFRRSNFIEFEEIRYSTPIVAGDRLDYISNRRLRHQGSIGNGYTMVEDDIIHKLRNGETVTMG